ncbi:3509_t:CDS:2, partial [Ambispora gerdemannii]
DQPCSNTNFSSATSLDWNISDFLEECNIKKFKNKIEAYLTSLETIADTWGDKEFDSVAEDFGLCVIQVFETSHEANGSKPYYIIARNWEKNHTSRGGTAINFYGDYQNNGIMAVNPVNNTFTDFKGKKSVHYTETNTDSDPEYELKRRGVSSTAPRTPPQVPRDLDSLTTTPNKRPLENEEVQHILIVSCLAHSSKYSQDISVICAFGKTITELALEIGEELVIELSSVRDINPAVWTPALENYIDTALKETGKNLKLQSY